ncbi:hypothetical protein VTJ49DRAFT_2155 [Mycothermus thermophilus]|uniref:Amino acid permease/ SLC12A domain-containing protein n=1 Tax=Humicola insolens TaxID=85995 RepID=A0ABR3VN64_HUMIN
MHTGFVSLVTASQLINFAVICVTYLRSHGALRVQGVDRRTLPYRATIQPYAAWYALIACSAMAFIGGYAVFLPGRWDVPTFLFSYTMIGVCPILYVAWKLLKRTCVYRSDEVDLQKNMDEIAEYEKNYVPTPPKNLFERMLDRLFV